MFARCILRTHGADDCTPAWHFAEALEGAPSGTWASVAHASFGLSDIAAGMGRMANIRQWVSQARRRAWAADGQASMRARISVEINNNASSYARAAARSDIK